MHHQLLAVLSVASVGVSGVLAAKQGLPIGVAPEDAKLYLPSSDGKFTCLTNPSVVIPFAAVNDDYCDCPDGSDEPGTSACSQVKHKDLAIRGFYCTNKGHTPQYLPLNRVNDGVCDYEICCDGGDEYAHVGGVKCPDRCKEIGERVRKLLGETQKTRNEGARLRAELVKKAEAMRGEVRANVEQLKSVIGGLEEKLKLAETTAKEVEAREIARIRLEEKSKKAGKKRSAGVEEKVEKVVRTVEEIQSEAMRVVRQRDGLKAKVEELEGILKAFKDTYNPNFNDEGVKSAVRKWEEYVAAGKSVFFGEGDGREESVEEGKGMSELVSEVSVGLDELTMVDEEEEVVEPSIVEKYLPGFIQGWARSALSDLRQTLVDNGLLAEKVVHSTPTDSKAVSDAKAAVAQIDTDLTSYRNQLRTAETTLTTDYGPSSVFLPLKDVCVNANFGEYNYEFCFFGKAHQKSNKDNSSSFLGEHRRIEVNPVKGTSEAEEGIFPAGEVEQQHEEKVSGVTIYHEGGARCWNGPERSARVELYCSVVNELRLVVEVEKCVYMYEVGTPAVCEGAVAAEERIKDEL